MRTRRAHAHRSRRAALICQTSHERHAFGPQLWTSCPAGTRKAEGSAALPSRVQQRCPRAPSPEPCKGRRPKNRHSKKRAKRVSALVLGLPVPGLSWFRVAGSPALPLRVPVWPLSSSCFFPLAAGVTFQLLEGGTSGQTQGHRPKNRPFQVSPFTWYFLTWCLPTAQPLS